MTAKVKLFPQNNKLFKILLANFTSKAFTFSASMIL